MSIVNHLRRGGCLWGADFGGGDFVGVALVTLQAPPGARVRVSQSHRFRCGQRVRDASVPRFCGVVMARWC